MKLKKVMAVTLAAALVTGNAATVFAADDTGSAVGEGTSLDHVNKEITSVTLPGDSAVADVFNYVVDPEQLIKDSGKLADDTAVTGNEDGVYFKNKDNSYSSSSDEVEFEGKNSVDVDVSVKAEVDADEKSIALVEDDDALTAATDPALLMTLTVGTDTAQITKDGATAKEKIEGKKDNFEVVVDGGAHKYQAKTGASDWGKTTVKLSGKTNNVDVPDGAGAMTAPKITLTWTVAKHSDAPAEAAPSIATTSYTLAADTAIEVTASLGSGDLAAENIVGVEKADGSTLGASNYAISGSKITFSAAWVNTIRGKLNDGDSAKYKIVFDDDASTKVELTFTK